MEVKTQDLERVLEALSPTLAAELNRVARETRESLEREFQISLQTAIQAAVRDAESTSALKAHAELERAVEAAKDETRRQVTAELESHSDGRIRDERTKFEETAAQRKHEALLELSKVETERDQWRMFAETQQQLALATSQKEILARFLRIAEPFANGLAVYVSKGEGLSLWKSIGAGAFPEIISRQTTDPDSYFRSLSVRGQSVGAISAAPPFKPEALEFLATSLEHAIEVFGLKLRAPAPKMVTADRK
jgi:hypothetical protein